MVSFWLALAVAGGAFVLGWAIGAQWMTERVAKWVVDGELDTAVIKAAGMRRLLREGGKMTRPPPPTPTRPPPPTPTKRPTDA